MNVIKILKIDLSIIEFVTYFVYKSKKLLTKNLLRKDLLINLTDD